MKQNTDPFGWRERSIYPKTGPLLFIRCDVDTTAHHVATGCEGNYGARYYIWRIPDPEPPDKDFPYLKGKIGVLSQMGRIVDASPFIVMAAHLDFPATPPEDPRRFKAPIPHGVSVIEVILSELSPPYHARTTVTFKAYLVDLRVIEYLTEAFDEFLEDYPACINRHYEAYPLLVDPASEKAIQPTVEAFIATLETRGFEQKKTRDPEAQSAEYELAERWDSTEVRKVVEMSTRKIPIPLIAQEVVRSESEVKRIRDQAARAGLLNKYRRRKKKPPPPASVS